MPPNQIVHSTSSPGISRLSAEYATLRAISKYAYGEKFYNTDIHSALPEINRALIQGVLIGEVNRGLMGWDRVKRGVFQCWRVEPPTIRKKETE